MQGHSKQTIVLIEDDPELTKLINYLLGNEFHLHCFSSISEAKQSIFDLEPGLIILDELLPDGSGTTFCFHIRNGQKGNKIPILMVTRQDELKDKLLAFDAGIDDYIVKPFEPLELKARVKRHLHISQQLQEEQEIFQKGNFIFNLANYSAIIKSNTQQIALKITPLEFKLLFHLAKREGQVMTRDQLIENIWGSNNNILDRTVDQHISRIRRKIDSSTHTIKSIHGVGYVFTTK